MGFLQLWVLATVLTLRPRGALSAADGTALAQYVAYDSLASLPAEASPKELDSPSSLARRKLISLTTPGGTKFFHQPLVNCLSYNATNMALYPSLYPACCTLTAADCAARCEAVPTCTGCK